MVSSLFLSFWLAAFASLVVALPRGGRSRHYCGVHISEARVRSGERRFQAHRLPPESGNTTATLNIYFHVVYSNETVEGGYIPNERIVSQVQALNRDYNATGISWNLKNVTRIKSEDWFTNVAPDSENETAMKKVFRQGGKSDLNVYTVGFLNSGASGLLGIATFPMDYESAPQSDGIMLLHSTLPGGNIAKYNLGRTLTHEVGHWVGLYHTFQGGCKAPGDEVGDTPPQAKASEGCPKRVASCGTGELNLNNNFMDYLDDACMDSFTPEQITRMRAQLATYRDVAFN